MLILTSKLYKAKTPEDRATYYSKMVKEDLDAMILRLFEAFLEAAPQLVLQVYILTLNGLDDGWFLGKPT